MITLQSVDTSLNLWYRKDKDLAKPPTQYRKPFWIKTTSDLSAYAELRDGSKSSKLAAASYMKHPHPEWKIAISSEYNPQYTAGGDDGIIDGLFGDLDWRKGGWQGYQGQSLDCVIDLGKVEERKKISISVLEDTRSWIYYPKGLIVEVSSDGKNYVLLGAWDHKLKGEEMRLEKKEMGFDFLPGTKFRFARIAVINYGKLPAWHQSPGEDAFIFIDEIIIR